MQKYIQGVQSHFIFSDQIIRDVSSSSSSYVPSKSMPQHSMYQTHTGDHHIPLNVNHYRYPSSTTSPIDIKPSTFTHQHARTTPINILQNQPISPLQNNLDSPSPLVKPTPLSSPDLSTNYSQISKHWLWNSNFFYPTSRHDGFLPYSSNFSGIFSSSRSTSMDLLSKSIDLSQHEANSSEANSDDSLDNNDNGKRSPSSRPSSKDAHKKKNPYSIEELLKKPEKRIKLDTGVTAFHPSILIHENATIGHCEEMSGDEKYEKSNIPIEVCE